MKIVSMGLAVGTYQTLVEEEVVDFLIDLGTSNNKKKYCNCAQRAAVLAVFRAYMKNKIPANATGLTF
jgi:hypothetical protein